MSDRWSRLQDVYLAALDVPPEARAEVVRLGAGDDADLETEVLGMLAARGPSILDGPAGLRDVARLALDTLAPGTHIGPYRVIEEVGQGGMGEVYRAERADGLFEQTVALKLVKRGMDSHAVLRRFEAERRILGRLDHTGIARVLDGGLSSDGRPWLAMEFVEGQTITDYADAHALDVDARLGLFQQVCQAVGYAHRQLVVHRDLKPSNVLVARDGQVKLLDFGIARVLTGDDEAVTLLTAPGQFVLTPEYAAPEQVAGGPISTATDVYALGVLLYELLAGQRPYTFDARTPAVVNHVVRTVEPPRPSTVVGERPPTTGQTVDRLRRQLAGDLDTICLTALRKEPDRRYASAEAFADDLQRHRDGLPVRARPDTAGYRARKFVRRHLGAVVGTAAAVVALVAITGFYTARLADERDRAETEVIKAREVSAFLADLFAGSDPAQARGDVLTARELLDQGAARIARELGGQPDVQAQMLGTIGGVYRSLGLFPEASEALTQSLALLDSLGTDAPATARAQTALARLRVDQGAFAPADSLLGHALATQRSDPRVRADLSETLDVQGSLLRESGDYDGSEASLSAALAVRRTLDPGDSEATAALLSALGRTALELGRYDDAQARYAEALAIRRRRHGDRHPGVTENLRELAALHLRERDFDRAEPLLREALATDSVLVGVEHPAFVEDLTLYGDLLSDRSHTPDALAVYDRALRLTVGTYGPNHPRVADTYVAIGEAALRARDNDRALAYYQRALDVRRRALPAGHADIANTLNKLGQLYIVLEDYEAAERYTRDGIDVLLQTQSDDGFLVLNHRSTLARLLSNTGRHGEAVALTRDILARRTALLGRSHRTTTRSVFNLAYMLRRKGTPASIAEARIVADEMLALYGRGFAPDSREWAYALREYADVLRASGDEPDARTAYRQALVAFRASLGPDHPATRSVEERLRGE